MKRLLMLIFLCASATFAQGASVRDVVLSSSGRPIGGATIRVCASSWAGLAVSPCTPLSSVYSNVALTTPAANPSTTDALGNYYFFVASGTYWIQVSGPGITPSQFIITPSIASGTPILDCATFSGGDAAAKIIACLAALPTGGVADAQSASVFGGAQTGASTINIAKSNLTLLMNPTMVLASTANPPMKIGDCTNTYDNIQVLGRATIAPSGAAPTKGIWICGPASGELRSVKVDLFVDGTAASGTVDGVYMSGKLVTPEIDGYIHHFTRDGLRLAGTTNIDHINPVIYARINANNRYGLYATLTYNLQYKGPEIATAAGSASPRAVRLEGVNGASFTGTLASNVTHAFGDVPTVEIADSGGTRSHAVSFYGGCYIDGDPAAYGPRVSATSTYGLSFEGCTFVSVSNASSWKNIVSFDSTVTGLAASGNFNFPNVRGNVWTPPLGSDQTFVVADPTGVPVVTSQATGGSIAAGTYYFKIAYKNFMGRTKVSPAASVILSGATSAILAVAQNDTNWWTGAYCAEVYASSDNVNFYLQTPTVVTQDFMVGTTCHKMTMGGGTQLMFPSLTLSGTLAPTTNTATTNLIQATVNSTRGTAAQRFGATEIPAIAGGTTLNTPLILTKGDAIKAEGNASGIVVGTVQSDLYGDFPDTKLATVMNFGGDMTLGGVEVRGSGNAAMVIGGAAYQAGSGGTVFRDCALATLSTSGTYSALVAQGINYRIRMNNCDMTGDRSVVEYRNVAGSSHIYNQVRWNAGSATTSGFIRNVVGWQDADAGTGSSFFPNGIGDILIKDGITEGGKGLLFDAMNLSITFDTISVSDSLVQPGVDSILKAGLDASFGFGAGSSLKFVNGTLGTCANCRVGTNLVGGGNISLFGNSHIGIGQSTGANVTIDLNNVGSGNAILADFSTGAGLGNFDPNVPASVAHPINVNSQTVLTTLSNNGFSTTQAWNETMSRLWLIARVGANMDRTHKFGFRNQGDYIELNYETAGVVTQLAKFNRLGLGGNGTWNYSQTAPNFISNVATGTQPYATTSTTKNANLNADLLDDLNTASAATASTVATRDANADLTSRDHLGRRFKATGGTPLVNTDFALHANWGTTATIGTITGSDQFFQATITSSGTGQGASPTVVLTFKDGTWTNAPAAVCNRQEFSSQPTVTFSLTTTATTLTLTFNGSPVAAQTYTIACHVGGI